MSFPTAARSTGESRNVVFYRRTRHQSLLTLSYFSFLSPPQDSTADYLYNRSSNAEGYKPGTKVDAIRSSRADTEERVVKSGRKLEW